MVPISSRKPSFPFPVVCLLTHLVLRCINEENCVLLDLQFVQNFHWRLVGEECQALISIVLPFGGYSRLIKPEFTSLISIW